MHCRPITFLRQIGLLFSGLGVAMAVLPAWAQAVLHCEVTYAGAAYKVLATPVQDPYGVNATDMGGRFRFKAVVVGQGAQVERIGLYVYQNTAQHPVLVQHAKYLPPFAQAPVSLTGEQRLYAGHMERELIYRCELAGVKP